MLVEQVNRGHLQSLQHCLNDLTNAIRPAVDTVARPVRIDPESELGRDYDTIAERRQRLASQFFVRERSIGLCGVEHRHVTLDRGVNEPDGVLPIAGGAVHPRKPHAPVPDRRYLQAAVAERPLVHDVQPFPFSAAIAPSRPAIWHDDRAGAFDEDQCGVADKIDGLRAIPAWRGRLLAVAEDRSVRRCGE
jgi:hypothetical protein